MTKVSDTQWPSEYADLKRIEEFMICGICYEYMETSVMTPCSHNYCSVCIRKYLHYKTQCPACFHVFFEKDLYINRVMDQIIQHYLEIRLKLLSLIANKNVSSAKDKLEVSNCPPVRPARSNQNYKSYKVLETLQCEKHCSVATDLSSSTVPKYNVPSSRINKTPKTDRSIAKIFNTPNKKVVSPCNITIKSVICPVCSVEISETHVNRHLDACLKQEMNEGTIKNKVTALKYPPLPKLVLRVMKDAELRKKMKEFGLSTQGDRKTLENRFTRYSIIYNAECDKLVPRTIPDLIRQCEKEEKQERKMDNFLISAAAPNRLQIERNANEEKIEEAQKNYREANKSIFDKLIEDVKKREELKKDKNILEGINFDSKPSTSIDNDNLFQNTSKNEANSFHIANEYAFQDIDSDESCPLQQYRSDDPIKCSINFNNSSTSISASLISPTKEGSLKEGFSNSHIIKTFKSKENRDSKMYKKYTDQSSDEDVQSSPILSTNQIRKKFKVSRNDQNKSNTFELSQSILKNEEYFDIENYRIVARNLCDDIINDFSVDDLQDNKSDKCIDKSQENETEKVGKSILDSVNLNAIKHTRLYEQNLNYLNTSVNNASFYSSTNNCNQYMSTPVINSEEFDKQKFKVILGISQHLNDTKLEKENDASLDNKNVQFPVCEVSICRPVKTSKHLSQKSDDNLKNKSHEIEETDSLKDIPTLDSTLKRRRGRPKVNFTNYPASELQNLPKRPVRRRQIIIDHNIN